MIIFLEWLLPAISSDLPKAGGPRQRFCSVLLRMGFTYAPPVTRKAVVSYTALPPLPAPGKPETEETYGFFPLIKREAVYFCCTFLRVASTGRYPAFCPVKPGLSSPAVFRHLQPRSFVLLELYSFHLNYAVTSVWRYYTWKQLPPINSLRIELCPIFSPGTGRK